MPKMCEQAKLNQIKTEKGQIILIIMGYFSFIRVAFCPHSRNGMSTVTKFAIVAILSRQVVNNSSINHSYITRPSFKNLSGVFIGGKNCPHAA